MTWAKSSIQQTNLFNTVENYHGKQTFFPRVNFNVFDKSLLERKEKDLEFCFFQDPDQACVSASEMAYPLFLLQLL